METFDPVSATARYLATMPATAQARAAAYTAGSNWIDIWNALVVMVVAGLILRSGLLDRLSNRLERNRARPNLTAFACGGALFLSAWLIQLPWHIYTDWARERVYGLSRQPLGAFVAQAAIQACFNALFSGLFILCLYAFMRRTGRRWFAWAGLLGGVAIILALVVEPITIGPLINHYM